MLQTPKKSTKIVKSAFLSRESTTKQINFSPLSELDESFLINKNFGSPESNLSSPTLSKGLFAFSKNRIRKMSALKLALRNNDLNPESKDENLKSNYEDEQSMESEEDDEIYDEMEDKNVENGKNDFLMEKRHFVTAESPCHNILQDENCLDSGVNSVATRILGKHREKRIARKKVINAKDSNKRESITIPEDLTSHTNLIRDTDSKSISPPDSGLRRSKRLLLNAPIHAKAVLGTPQFNKLKQQRSIQKQINQYSSEDSSDDSEEREFCVNNEPEDENIEEEKSVASNYSSDSEMEQNLLLDFATSHKRVADSDNESISSDILNRKKFKKKRLGLEPKNKVYFLELANERLSKTSDNTCAKLPSMTHQNLLEYLEYYEQKHLKLILQNEKYYEKDFKQWFFQLNHGFNILFYGYGSKYDIINKFKKKFLLKFNLGICLTINGFFPNLNIKQIVDKITDTIFYLKKINKKKTFVNLSDQMKYIKIFFETNTFRLFLIIHNIDGLCLVNEKSQNTLSQLSTIKNISLICSVDHQNSTLLWCQKLINLFRFSMIDLTTFKNYSVETSFENSLMAKLTSDQAGGSSGFNGLTLSGCQYVLKSLPKNSRKIFKEFLSHQINEMESKNNERFSQDNEVLESNTKTTNKTKNASYKNCGMNFETLYLICIEKFYASSRQVLQTILVEFKDHNLIVYSNSESNSNDNMGDDQNMVCPMDLENLKILYESID